MPAIHNIIFDLGGVLIDWNPKHLYTDDYFDSEETRDYFLTQICSPEWNEEQDGGKSIVTATLEKIQEFPEWEAPIRDFYGRWTTMLNGPIQPTVEIFRELKDSGRYRIYALTNWQDGLFDIAQVRYDFLQWFDGIVVSGVEKTRKPFPDFYQILFDRYAVNPSETVFIDDNHRNAKAGADLGLQVIHFTGAEDLRKRLQEMELL